MMRSTALLASCTLLLLGGCSSDDDGGVDAADTTASAGDGTSTTEGGDGDAGGDPQAFCDFVADNEGLDVEEDPEAVAAAMEEMRRLAPEDLQDEIDVLFGLIEKMEGIDEDDPDAFGEIMMLMFDPKVAAATESLDEFGVEECGMEPGEFMDSGTSDEPPTSVDLGPDTTDDFEFPDSENGMSIDVLQAFVDETYGDEEWADKLSSWSIMGETDVQIGPFEEDLTVDEAMAACEALAEKVFELEPEATLEIMDIANDVVVRRGPDDDACAPVL